MPKGPNLWRMLAYVGRPLLWMAVWDIFVVVAYQVLHWRWIDFGGIPLALYGSAIGIIVGFRNNSAFGRWWEARILWGAVVNNSRSIGRQAMSILHPSRGKSDGARTRLGEIQRDLILHQIAYVHALRQHLRGLDPLSEIGGLIPAGEVEKLRGDRNVPLTIQRHMGTLLREALDSGFIDPLEWQAMDRNLDDLADAQGGAERIKNTPIPKQYDYFPMLFTQIYCVLLPIGMVSTLGWYTPLGSTLVGLMFVALDKIGRDLENPFDNTIHDVPMTAITRTIEINLRQLLGETKLPDPVQPVRGVLW